MALTGKWDASLLYKIGDIVIRNERRFQAIADNTEKDPLSEPTYWTELASTPAPEYISQATFDDILAAVYVAPAEQRARRDAFGRLRVSTPSTIFDSKLLVADQPTLFWDDQQVSGSGTSSTYAQADARMRLAVSASTAGKRVRQSRRWFPYQPGKSQLFTATFNFNGGTAGVTKRVGLFTDTVGLFLQLSGETVSFVIRKGGVDRVFSQTIWNTDILNGTGFSGETLDLSRCQIFFVDFQWLGTGEVRFGFIIGSKTVIAHEVFHSNVATSVYIGTPNLPVRYEISNDGTGVASNMDCICCAVSSEAGQDDNGLEMSADRGSTPLTTGNDANLYPLLGLRLKSTHQMARVALLDYAVACTSTADHRIAVCFNPTLAGTAVTWSAITNSALEISRPTGASTVSAEGLLIASGYTTQSNNFLPTVAGRFGGFLSLGSSIAGVSDTLWLCVQRLNGTTETFYGSLRWRETI